MATSDWTQTLEVIPVSASTTAFASAGAQFIAFNGQTGDVRKSLEIRSRAGGLIQEGFEDVSTGINIWLQAADSKMIQDFKRRNLEVTHKAYISSDPSIVEGHQIINVTGFVGKEFLIRGIENQAGRDQVFKLALQEDR